MRKLAYLAYITSAAGLFIYSIRDIYFELAWFLVFPLAFILIPISLFIFFLAAKKLMNNLWVQEKKRLLVYTIFSTLFLFITLGLYIILASISYNGASSIMYGFFNWRFSFIIFPVLVLLFWLTIIFWIIKYSGAHSQSSLNMRVLHLIPIGLVTLAMSGFISYINYGNTIIAKEFVYGGEDYFGGQILTKDVCQNFISIKRDTCFQNLAESTKDVRICFSLRSSFVENCLVRLASRLNNYQLCFMANANTKSTDRYRLEFPLFSDINRLSPEQYNQLNCVIDLFYQENRKCRNDKIKTITDKDCRSSLVEMICGTFNSNDPRKEICANLLKEEVK